MARLFDDAASEYLQVDSAPFTDYPFTMACWFNLDVAYNHHSLMFVGRSLGSSDYWSLEARGQTEGDPVVFVARNDTEEIAVTSTGYSVDAWHHACGVGTSTTLRTAYIDGGSPGTSSVSKIPDATIDRCCIARLGDSSPSQHTSGMIAEAGIWNVALTAAEVAIVAGGYSPLFVRPESLVAYWPLIRDEDQDRVGGYDLTAFNTPTVGDHPPVIYPTAPIMGVPSGAIAGSPWYTYAQMT